MTIELIVQLLCLGCIVGVLAGLLGIGGGLVVVPALLYLLPQVGIAPENAMQFALGTSLATIILTSGSSAFNHFKLGNVETFAVKYLMPGVVIGGLCGSSLADWIPGSYLPKVFGIIVFLLSIQMFLSIKTKASHPMPGATVTTISGIFIGTIASLAGIGGGALSVPFLNRHGVEMRKAVGSSSVCGCFIAISGMIGFIWHGSDLDNLPEYSLGYIYLPALLFVSCTSILTTRIGAKLATTLPTPILKRVFSVFLMFVSINMLLR
ncbi:sulfite exporter TauE/SafE family protein [Vibrio viridaestus]|uniref:Probable membrane transporter protein n=1 Tax=Vibrio viridaestus TaxID=2487322 RepID=A0A3N9TFS1_9VIBR|nr:sulfite exporter TauE/SafE family protein [Vibrio viridaestus]RQW63108.1 sulfite exporter TauE/SafE family protein [Vibrio viridaestus]